MVLVQGPPGAGKSTTLIEFGARVDNQLPFWTHKVISIAALYDPANMAKVLGDNTYDEQIVVSKGYTGPVGISGGITAGHTSHSARTSERPDLSVNDLLTKHAGKKGLLLTLDEFQDAAIELPNQERRSAISQVLRDIRNSDVGAPVVLLAGGLGNSAAVLGEFGVSRPGYLHNIGRLEPEDAYAVIEDWIVKSGQAHEMHSDTLERWISAIDAETDRWPQHIHKFAPQAAEWLLNNTGSIPDNVPNEVMDSGTDGKRAYYAQRIITIAPPYRFALARLVQRVPAYEGLDMREVVDALALVALPGSRHPGDVAQEAFAEAVRKGMLAEDSRGLYQIPIPSMRAWLLNTYGAPQRSRDAPDPLRQPDHGF